MVADEGKLDTDQSRARFSSINDAQNLADNIPKILKLWEARVRTAEAVAQHLDTYALLDHIPKFLNNLVKLLKGESVISAAIQAQEIPKEHGEQRTQFAGYSLDQVIEEFRILREVIFEILEQYAPLTPHTRDTILQAIDQGIKHSVATYSKIELDRERAAAQKARDAEALIQALIEGSPVGLGLVDQDLRYVRVNQTLAKLNGRPPELHIGRTVRDVLGSHADRLEAVLRKILESGKALLNQQEEIEVPADGNKTHHFLANYFPVLTSDGNVIGVGGAIADITEQKTLENRLRESEEFRTRVFESSEDCFKVLDLEGHLTFIDETSAQHLELNSPGDVTGKKWIEFWIRAEDQQQAHAAVKKAASGERAEFVGNYRTQSGKREWWHVVLTPMKGPSGKPASILAVSRDITALRKTEERREELARLLDLTHDAIIIRDEEDKVLYWNRGAEAIYGYSPAEALGKVTHELLKTRFDEPLTAIKEKLKHQGFWSGELVHTLKDGRRVVAMSRWVLDNTPGRPWRALESNSDITYLKAAENDLRQREQLFRTIFDLAASGKAVIDVKSNRFIRVNRKFCEMLGYTQEELLQKNYIEVTHPEDRGWQEQTYQSSVSAEHPWTIEKRYLRKDGSIIWVLISAAVLETEAGKPKTTISTVFDITARKLTEEELRHSRQRFQLLAEAAPQIVWISDSNGNAEYFNSRWTEYTGLSPEQSLGQGWHTAIHPDDQQKWQEALKSGSDVVTFEERKRHKDGNYYWYLTRIALVKNDDGRVVRLIGTATDIHAQKQIQLQLERERELRERFTSALAHDLRTPLTSAKLSMQMALRNVGDLGKQKKQLGGAIESVNRVDQMITDLLDANRIRAGQQLVQRIGNCDLRQIVAESVHDMSVIHGQRFEIRGPGRIEGRWSCENLRRVFDNLLSNAVKYGAADSAITVLLEEEGETARASVHNFGNPIPAKGSEHLFDMFHRAKSAESTGQQGWGIGLTLVKGIVESHGGHVSVESNAEDGTTFQITLPKNAKPQRPSH